MLKGAKLVLAGETSEPIWAPSTVTITGCTYGETPYARRAAMNESVYVPVASEMAWLIVPVLWMKAVWTPCGALAAAQALPLLWTPPPAMNVQPTPDPLGLY